LFKLCLQECEREGTEPDKERLDSELDVSSKPTIYCYCIRKLFRHKQSHLLFKLYKQKLTKREGTQYDKERLDAVLKSLKFEVHIHNNLTYHEIMTVLKEGE